MGKQKNISSILRTIVASGGLYYQSSVYIILQLIAASLAVMFSLWFRFEQSLSIRTPLDLLQEITGFSLISIGVFIGIDPYPWNRPLWGFFDFLTNFKVAFFSILFFIPLLLITGSWNIFFPAVLGILLFVFPMCLGVIQGIMTKIVKNPGSGSPLNRVLFLGDQNQRFMSRILEDNPLSFHVLGALSLQDNTDPNAFEKGIPILGTINDFSKVILKLTQKFQKPDLLIITDSGLKGKRLREFLIESEKFGIQVRRPARFACEFVEPLEPRDLLEPLGTTNFNANIRSFFQGKRILITGGAGIISQHLIEALIPYAPLSITLFDQNERDLHKTIRNFQEKFPYVLSKAIIGNVRDQGKVFNVFAQEKPDIVFHGAGLSPLDGVEISIIEGAATNVLGTVNVADACVACGVKWMISFSHQRAGLAQSPFGMIQRVAEMYCQILDSLGLEKRSMPSFLPLRIGDILEWGVGVVFQRQIRKGGPVTIPHPEMVRYLTSVNQTILYILQACAISAPQEAHQGKIFNLHSGENISLLELAEHMIRLAGLSPYQEIPIIFTGLQEEPILYPDHYPNQARLQFTGVSRIWSESTPLISYKSFNQNLVQLREAVLAHNVSKCLQIFQEILGDTGIQPISRVKIS